MFFPCLKCSRDTCDKIRLCTWPMKAYTIQPSPASPIYYLDLISPHSPSEPTGIFLKPSLVSLRTSAPVSPQTLRNALAPNLCTAKSLLGLSSPVPQQDLPHSGGNPCSFPEFAALCNCLFLPLLSPRTAVRGGSGHMCYWELEM